MRSFSFRADTLPPTKAMVAQSLDDFAELLSLDIPLAQIADKMGVTFGTACVLLRQLNDKYGWQAC